MKQTIQNPFKNETLVAILLILLTTVITYGLSLSKLGYYHDDWFVLWSGHVRGPASLIPLFSTDRPFMGVVYSVLYRILGDTVINWQLYALLWRFLGGVAFFWILRLLWPNQKYLTTLMTVLFIVYPGFLSQPNANTKQNHLYGFGTALFSIALMFQAMKTNQRVWKMVCIILSVLLTANYLFIYEYMIGFEGTRLILLGYVLFQEGFQDIRSLAKETLRRIWPYWVVTAGFLYWRIFIFSGSRNATDASQLVRDYLSNFRSMAVRSILETAKDFVDTSIFAWFVQPYQQFAYTPYSNLARAFALAGIVLALILLYTFVFKKWWGMEQDEAETPRMSKTFVWLGAAAILFAIVPVILSDRQVELYDTYKSYGLHPTPGVILLVVGLVLMLQPKFRTRALLGLAVISIATQVLNADYWIGFWDFQRNLWWQFTWRAPGVKDNTLVMAYSYGYNAQQDYEIWGPLNLIYHPEPAKKPLIQAEVLNPDTSFSIFYGDVLNNNVRDIKLHRDFNNLLLLTVSPYSSCVHVIDGSLPVYSARSQLEIQQVGKYSHIGRIISTGTAPVPPAAIFGSEPAHGWCYYYQKASLARQNGDWEEISKIYDQVRALGLETGDKSEMVPFFEALVNLGRVEDAKALYDQEFKGQSEMRLPLCISLASDPGYPPEFHYDYQTIHDMLCGSQNSFKD